MKFLKSIFTIAMFAMLATSCGNDDEPVAHDNYMEQQFTGCFNYIYKQSLNQGVMSKGTTYMFRWRADFTADVYIYNAKFSAMMPDGVDIVIEGLKWTSADGIKSISATDVVPSKVTMNGALTDASAYVFDKLEISSFERRVSTHSPEYIPVINVAITIGDIKVVTLQKYTVYFGSTGVVNSTAGTNFTSKAPYYAVTLDPETMKAKIEIFGAKFAEKMPSLDMTFSDVPFTASVTGYTLTCDELIPTIKNVPYPDYAITNLLGQGNLASGLNLQFDCMGVYTVRAQLGYSIVADAVQ